MASMVRKLKKPHPALLAEWGYREVYRRSVAGEVDQRILNVLRGRIEGSFLGAILGRGGRSDGANQHWRCVEGEEAALGDPRVDVPTEARQVRLLRHDDRAIRLAH